MFLINSNPKTSECEFVNGGELIHKICVHNFLYDWWYLKYIQHSTTRLTNVLLRLSISWRNQFELALSELAWHHITKSLHTTTISNFSGRIFQSYNHHFWMFTNAFMKFMGLGQNFGMLCHCYLLFYERWWQVRIRKIEIYITVYPITFYGHAIRKRNTYAMTAHGIITYSDLIVIQGNPSTGNRPFSAEQWNIVCLIHWYVRSHGPIARCVKPWVRMRLECRERFPRKRW